MRRGVVQSVTRGRACVFAVLLSASARAAPCGAPDLVAAYPGDGATRVPLNANFRAQYAASAQGAGATVSLEQVGADTTTIAAQFDAAETTLEVDAPGLVANANYVLTWPGLPGSGTSDVGAAKEVSFTAGTGQDVAAPTFAGLASVAWDVDREHDDCTDDIQQRYVFDLTPGAASDDFDSSLLAMTVFQTRGAGLDEGAPAVPLLTTHFPTSGTVRVSRALADATGLMCFSANLEDLAGHKSGGTDKEVCVTTTAPPFFYGCTLAAPSRPGPSATAAALAVLGLCLLARRAVARAS
jgi:hypothetical protein